MNVEGAREEGRLASRPRASRAIPLLLAGLALVGGCTGPLSDQAGVVAESFSSLAHTDAAGACRTLTEHTRAALEKESRATCAEALGQADLPASSAVRSSDVYGHDARVTLQDDVIFLARFPEGWEVVAAGCTPQPDDQPYDCTVGGG